MNVFAYGTLMFPEIWRRVVGREFPALRGHVAGFAAYRVADGVYPVMVAEPHAMLGGLIIVGVDDAAIKLLDEYESDLYERVEVHATDLNGRVFACHAYLLPDERKHLASSERWDAARFEREELAGYLRRMSEA